MLQINPLLKKLFKSPARSWLLIIGVVVIGFGFAQPAYGYWDSIWDSAKDGVLTILSYVLYFFMIYVMGKLAVLATDVLVYVAQLNNFTDLPVIIEAWSVVRDLANMFFIVILLVIAFGTLFKIEAYSWKKLLPKMVLAAVLVNYSRAICGFIVDASQIVMLTFVAAIKDAAAVGFTEAFQLDKILKIGSDDVVNKENIEAGGETRFLAIVAAGFMLMTMFTVQCVYIVVLVGRLVMIWFLTVMSPLAYVTNVLPQTERFARQWWEMFGRYVTVGPLAMFFLWLAMFIAAKSTDGLGKVSATSELQNNLAAEEAGSLEPKILGALQTDVVAGFVIATLMLMAGMKMALENSSEISEYTGKAANFGKTVGKFAAYGGAAVAGVTAVSYLNDRQAMKTGYDLNLPRAWKNWKHGNEVTRRRRENQIAATAAARHRQGNLLAGALGAGDQVVETGFTRDQFRGLGTVPVPFLGKWLNQKGIGISKEARFRRALEEEGKTEGAQVVAENDLAKKRSAHGKDSQTNQDFDREQNQLDAARDAAATTSGDHTSDPNMEFDASENGKHRSMIELRISKLQGSLTDSTVSDVEKQANAKEAVALQGALGSKFRQADIGVNMTSAVTEHFTDAQIKANDHAAKRDTATSFGKFHTQADIESFIDKQTDVVAANQAVTDAKHATHAAHTERHRLGPKMGSDWEIKFRSAVSEEASKIKTTDADALRDGFLEALETKKAVEMSAWYEKLCETGNDNEAYKALGLKFNAGENGARELAKRMQQAGLSQQATLSTMNRGSQLSEAVGHTVVSQMFDVKSGEIVFRSKEKQMTYAKGEEAKKNQKTHQTNATRLSVGELGETMDAEDAEYEEAFVERRILNILSTSKTDKTSETNRDFLKGTMRNKERWKLYQKVIKEKLGDQAPEALKRMKEECAKNGIRLAE